MKEYMISIDIYTREDRKSTMLELIGKDHPITPEIAEAGLLWSIETVARETHLETKIRALLQNHCEFVNVSDSIAYRKVLNIAAFTDHVACSLYLKSDLVRTLGAKNMDIRITYYLTSDE